jgi:hypothetical protein
MTAAILRILIFLVIGVAIYFGARRIWRDWRGQFKKLDEADRERDLKERQRPDVITLKRDKDGTYRPGGDDDRAA